MGTEDLDLHFSSKGDMERVHKNLKRIHLGPWETTDTDIGLLVVELLSRAPEMEELIFEEGFPLDAVRKEELSGALKRCRHLRRIEIGEYWFGVEEVLVNTYTESGGSPVLELLDVSSEVGVELADALGCLVRGNIKTISLNKFSSRIFASTVLEHHLGYQWLAQSLLRAPLLKAFTMDFVIPERGKTLETLGIFLPELWKASKNSHLLDIGFHLLFDSGSEGITKFVEKELSATYLKRFSVYFEGEGVDHFRSFLGTLASNSSVDLLTIIVGESTRDWMAEWAYLFNHLREKTSIRTLRIARDDENPLQFSDENFRDLMDLLQVNFHLEKIDVTQTSWAKEGKIALIEAALERNKKQAGYFSDLARANLKFDGAKAGRVFLCGSQYAGKTQLKVTMMKTMSKECKSKSLRKKIREKMDKVIGKIVPARTKGIEVELLCDTKGETISIWDFAGQQIFRALQTLFFPRISQACIFVFVFSPFEGEGKSRKPKENPHEAFVEELMRWLRYIASNTQITGRMLPQVLVIVTHSDKLEKYGIGLDLEVLKLEIVKLRDLYKDMVQLSPTAPGVDDNLIYHINAKVEGDVEKITRLVLSCLRNVLETKSPRVPNACSDLVSHLLSRPPELQHSPVRQSEDFYQFCSMQNSLLKKFNSTDEGGRKVLHAAALYMHDAGAICMTPAAMRDYSDSSTKNLKKTVVVDLNWLTENLLGQLISHGHDFEIEPGQASTADDGFIDPHNLITLIKCILKEKEGEGVNSEMIKELLFELDICYSVQSKKGVKYFMPMIFGGKNGTVSGAVFRNKLSWNPQHAMEAEYFGFRVQCYDKHRTGFASGFYARYQIHLRKQMENLKVLEENFIFSRYHVEIRINGCFIFVEIDQSGENHIDVMVQFRKEKGRDWAKDYVHEHIVQDFIDFCASPEKGCPSVQLVVGLLRTECVKRLIPRTLRAETQSVLIEELKANFQSDVESQLEMGGSDTDLFSYMYTWPEIREETLALASEAEMAQKLLSDKDFNEIRATVEKNHVDFWQNLDELRQVSSQLKEASLARSVASIESIESTQEPESFASMVSHPSFETRTDFSVAQKIIMRELLHIREQMAAGFEQVRSELSNFKSSMDEMRLRMTYVTSRVDTIIGCTRSKEIHKTPTRPYFTEDVTKREKANAIVSVGKPVRLHLMCEARHRPHFVDGQEGLKLCLLEDGQFSRSMRRLCQISIKMIWVLLSVGAQVAAGLGSLVPDISNLATGASLGVSAVANLALDSLELENNLSLVKDDKSVEEAWRFLREQLAEHLTREKCASLFKLYRVKYRFSDDPYAWLCRPCVTNGLRNYLLEEDK